MGEASQLAVQGWNLYLRIRGAPCNIRRSLVLDDMTPKSCLNVPHSGDNQLLSFTVEDSQFEEHVAAFWHCSILAIFTEPT